MQEHFLTDRAIDIVQISTQRDELWQRHCGPDAGTPLEVYRAAQVQSQPEFKGHSLSHLTTHADMVDRQAADRA
jgi:hypothetical protein